MRFLDDTTKAAQTVSSVQHLVDLSCDNINDDTQMDMSADDSIVYHDSIPDSVSEVSHRSSRSSSGTKKKLAQKQTEMEDKFLDLISEVSQNKRDVVNGFLDQLGDILRRLSYVRRRNLQRRLMDIAIQEEDVELMEKQNVM